MNRGCEHVEKQKWFCGTFGSNYTQSCEKRLHLHLESEPASHLLLLFFMKASAQKTAKKGRALPQDRSGQMQGSIDDQVRKIAFWANFPDMFQADGILRIGNSLIHKLLFKFKAFVNNRRLCFRGFNCLEIGFG